MAKSKIALIFKVTQGKLLEKLKVLDRLLAHAFLGLDGGVLQLLKLAARVDHLDLK